MPTPNPGVWLSQDAANRTERSVLDYERRVRQAALDQIRRNFQPEPPVRGILLQDLNDEGQAACQLTVRDPTRLVQKLAIVGEITAAGPGGGTFTLGVQGATGQVTPALSVYSTAAQVQAALQKLPAIGAKNVMVTLGQMPAVPATADQPATPAYFPGVLLIEFVGKFVETDDPPAMPTLVVTPSITGLTYTQIKTTVWADSGTAATVSALIPIGTPTPMRTGAVVAAIWFGDLGYGVIAAEGREFSAIGPGD